MNAPADPSKQEKKKTPFSVRFAFFIILVMMALFFPTTVLFCGAMLPTLVAAIIDNGEQRTAFLTVGAMNFAGVVPFWFQLWKMGHTINDALTLLMQPTTLLVSFGGAAVGWLVYYQVPAVVASVMALRGEKRLRDIDKRQKDLLRKWGQEVAGERAA